MYTKETIYNLDKNRLLIDIYGKDSEKQKKRYVSLCNRFFAKFPNSNEVALFSTPGRTEIGGNHTDHNKGCVLAGSVNLDAVAAACPSGNDVVTVYSAGYCRPFVVKLDNTDVCEKEKGGTSGIIRGIADGFKKSGYNIGGFNACITSDVKRGSGLSSSAAIEVLIGSIFANLFNKAEITAEFLAKTGQYAENVYFGKPCGLMDQMACASGGVISIDFMNTDEPKTERVELDLGKHGYCMAVVDTGGNHTDLTDDYASVPYEMRSVAKQMGREYLRGITKEELIAQSGKLRKACGDRAVLRAIHFVNDNERVAKQIQAIKNDNFDEFLGYVNDSGNSSWEYLQNCYTIKAPQEQGITLALAITREFFAGKKVAARVHGGGFAGTIQVFLPLECVEAFEKEMNAVFSEGCVSVLSIRNYGAVCIEK